MIKNFTKLLTTSLIASAFIFTGCGDTQSTENSASAIKPHKIVRVLEGEDLPSNYADFAAKIEMHAQIVDDKMFLLMEGKGVQTWDMAHMQVYIDIDYDENTGLSMGSGNYAIVGADYMVEDKQLFKSTSVSDWEWEYVGDVENARNKLLGGDNYTSMSYGNEEHYSKDIEIDTNLLEGLEKADGMKMRVSMEPINEDWGDTNNYVPVKTVSAVYLEGYQHIFEEEFVRVEEEYVRISDDGRYAFRYHSRSAAARLNVFDIVNQTSTDVYASRRYFPVSARFIDNNTITFSFGLAQYRTVELSQLDFK